MSVLLLVLGLFATGAGLGWATGIPLPHLGSWPHWGSSRDKPPPREFPVLKPSRPVRLAIPSIDVRAPVGRVGLAADGSIAVPPLSRHNEAGWYDQGPTPGEFGPAILVGHVDTKTGPSVFYAVAKLRPGARIEVTRADRSVALFEVNSVHRYDKARLPAQQVYGDFSRPALRLITCGGEWQGSGRGYADNIVVFASLVGANGSSAR